MGAKPDISEQILRAASDRIRHFGYAKTTMAEIASDLRMSAGNLYRFFASKLEIAEALARTHREAELCSLQEIVQCSDCSAREKLSRVLKRALVSLQALVQEQPRVVEIADIIARERPEFIVQRLAEERVFIRQILEEGIRNGEFDNSVNVEFLATCVQAAVSKFRNALIVANSDPEALRAELDGVLDLLLRGLNRRSAIEP